MRPPSGKPRSVAADGGAAARHAAALLAAPGAGFGLPPTTDGACLHPARRWAQSGLMALTGSPDAAATLCPVPLPSCADGALDAFRSLSGSAVLPGVSGAQLLVERAALAGLGRNGACSPTGHCRLLPTGDGVIALNLARAGDWELLPAWSGGMDLTDWSAVADWVRGRDTATLLEGARLLGLAAVDARHPIPAPTHWVKASRVAKPRCSPSRLPRVLDLSTLWAGPLCSHLWQAAGARVTKVEGSRRPDGARFGSRAFFELINRGKAALTLDLHERAGQRELRRLIGTADIVLEGSRPRALRQMGIVAEELIEAHPGLTWVSITGYGREEPGANWIAYGDDAAVAAGLSAIAQESTGEWLICGDAIADPLTGLHAAVAGWAGWLSGGGLLLDLSLAGTTAYCIAATAPDGGDYRGRLARWQRHLQEHGVAAAGPRPRNEVRPSAS